MTETPCKCDKCGHVTYIYKRDFRTYLLPALKLLSVNPPLTTAELASMFSNENEGHAREIDKHFAELRYWNLIEKVEGHRYRVTVMGQKFVDGHHRVPEWIWTKDGQAVPPPEGEDNGALQYAYEMAPHEFSDPRLHIEQAVASQLSLV